MTAFFETLNMLFAPNSELMQIVGVTLRMAVTSTAISFLLGIMLGTLIAFNEFKLKRFVLSVTSTLMSLPPVLAGLVVFFLLSRSGPLGQFKLLYSVSAMVTAQILLITPIVANMSATALEQRIRAIAPTMIGLGFSKAKMLAYMLYEARNELFSILFLGFGRALSEVGAAQIVGGNVQYKTRVMTTAIVLETNKGNFDMALALGILLLIIAFAINLAARALQKRRA